MTHSWSTMPLLPLRCILDHLSTEDAFAAMSTCRHWRSALLLYEGRRETLKLRTKNFEKNLYLARVFKRRVRKLHIYLDGSDPDIEKFVNFVLPEFFDTAKLQELLFIGPLYIQQSHVTPFILLKRVMTESLVFKHRYNLKRLVLLGCGISPLRHEKDKYSHEQLEYYTQDLQFGCMPEPGDTILSNTNRHLMYHSTLTHIVIDYDQMSTACLLTLSHLKCFRHISLNITNKRQNLLPINWRHVNTAYEEPLEVAINIVELPYRKFSEVMESVLLEDMALVSLKVMFCKSLYTPLLSHVSRNYQSTLKELVWVDSAYESTDPYHRIVRPMRYPQPDTYAHVNPFVLLCWQCEHLQRLVIHGYWVWQYDVLGFVRLRTSLTQLEISAIYSKQEKFSSALQLSEEGAVRVLCHDAPAEVDAEYIQEVNEYTDFKWKPLAWNKLHPAIRGRCTPQQRAHYVVLESTRHRTDALY